MATEQNKLLSAMASGMSNLAGALSNAVANRVTQNTQKAQTTAKSGGSSGYQGSGSGSDYYAGQTMSQSDQALLKSYGDNWNAAKTQEERDYWHGKAEDLRLSYGYKGGTDGSQYIESMRQQDKYIPENGDYDLSEYLRKAAAAKLESELAGLKVAYEKSMAGYDDQAARLPQQYDAARNNVAAQDALARKAFDERAVASGLSSGASGQAELARSSAYQRDIANLDQQQANAASDIQLAKTNLQSQYESAIAQARADGNAALANALYEELVRVQGLNREDAQIAAERELAELELAMKYAAKGSAGSKTRTKTGGGNEKKDTTSLILPDVDADEKAKHLYEKYGANPAPDTSQRDTSAYWSSVTPSNKQSGGKGYDNGSLTASQVKEMQAFYGLTQDGLWGPNSQKTAGSADEAWARYLREKYSANPAPDTSQRDTSAYWSSPYGQVLNDVQELAKAGESASIISSVIEAARSGGRITQSQADQLRAQFVSG